MSDLKLTLDILRFISILFNRGDYLETWCQRDHHEISLESPDLKTYLIISKVSLKTLNI